MLVRNLRDDKDMRHRGHRAEKKKEGKGKGKEEGKERKLYSIIENERNKDRAQAHESRYSWG